MPSLVRTLCALLVSLVFISIFFLPRGRAAAIFTVNDTGDTPDATLDGTCADAGGKCTLRAAIAEANNVAGTDTITFDIAGAGPHTIQLAGALPNLSDSVDILNTSGESVTVRRNTSGNYGIFLVNSGQTVNINGLTISNGSGSVGGGIYNNRGTLTLTNSTVSGNSDLNGGGGGGILNTGGTLTLTNSTVSGNSSNQNGGGIYNNGGTLTLTNSTVSGNSTSTSGGGIYNRGTLNVTNSTISGNSAVSSGGGIVTANVNPTLTGVTITDNRADSDNNGFGIGGGIYIFSGTPLLRSSIVAGNFNEDGATDAADDIEGPGSADGTSSYNLIGTGGSGGLTSANNNQVGVANPGLGALQNNGGATQTHALLSGSPAIDKGKNFAVDSGNNSILTDQRGFTRPVDLDDATYPDASGGDASDIGAYEAPTFVLPVTTTGYNFDFVVDNNASAPLTNFVTATMDSGAAKNTTTFYQTGFNAAAPTTGLPTGTTLTSAADSTKTFHLQPANGNNAVLLDGSHTTGMLTLNSPTTYQSLSFLSATGNGTGTIAVILNFSDGGPSESAGSFTSPDWFNGSNTAITSNGRVNVDTGAFDNVNAGNPRLYEATLSLSAAARLRPLSGVSFVWSGTGHTALFAVSGAAADSFASFVVNSTADTNDGACTALGTGNGCTLREALTLANADAGAETITFNIPGTDAGCTSGVCTIQLAGALPNLSTDMTIQGSGANVLTVRRNTGGNYRIFNVASGATVNISGLTVTNGFAAGGVGGGGILNSGMLTLQNSTVSGNNAGSGGGGIDNQGTLTVINSAISGNSSTNDFVSNRGGGINNEVTGTLTVINSTISGNSNVFGGGGGGISNSGALTMTNSTVSGNFASGDGGGIFEFNTVSTLTLTSVTITNNRARFNSPVDPTGNGGGIFITAGGDAPATPPLMRNTIVADNYLGAGTSPESDIQGSPLDGTSSYNLIGTGGSGGLTNGTNNNQVGVANPGLGALQNNGGATQTHALLSGSPAIDKGKNFAVDSGNNSILTDQRGFTRPVDLNDASYPNASGGDASDIGAYEAQTIPPLPTISGHVTFGGNGLAGVSVALSGTASANTTTDASGAYTFVNLSAGNYTVTPSKLNFTFTPNHTDLTLAGTNQIADFTATATGTPSGGNGTVLISEFRLQGPAPSGTPASGNANGELDEFIELYNNTSAAVNISGYTVETSAGFAIPMPSGATIPARGHYLIANTDGYSLAAYATPDKSYNNLDLPTTTGLVLRNGAQQIVDAVGFITTPSLYHEGNGLAPISGSGEYSFVRHMETGFPRDTGDNAQDFVFVSTGGGTYGGVVSILGAPGPESLTSPIQHDADIKPSLTDPTVASSTAPNRARNSTAHVCNGGVGPSNCTFGTLTIRRQFTNMTGQTVTRLRFRIVDVTTATAPSGTADLRALNSGQVSVMVNGNPVTVEGTSVETPPAQPNGGGLNSTLGRSNVAGTIVNTNITNGASVNVQFVLGVQQIGSFRFFISQEALP